MAQMTYADRRYQADSDPSTMHARRYFDELMDRRFSELQNKLGLKSLKLDYNLRMIAQYARGAESAYEVVPNTLQSIMEFVAGAKNHPAQTLEMAKRTSLGERFSDVQLLVAINHIAHLKTIHLDYWGYIGRSYRVPVYSKSLGKLSFFITWHENESFYEETSAGQIRFAMMLAALNPQTSFWDRFR